MNFPIALVLVASVTSPVAHAFDCKRATTEIERAICGDPILIALDGRTQKLFEQRRSQDRPDPKWVAEQKKWLKESRDACASVAAGAGRVACLKKAYADRIGVLANVPPKRTVTRAGGREVVTLLQAIPYNRSTTYTVLTAADSPAFSKINSAIVNAVEKLGCTDTGSPEDDPSGFDTSIDATATPFTQWGLIRVQLSVSEFCGGAHPNEENLQIYFDRTSGNPIENLLPLYPAKIAELTRLVRPALEDDCAERVAGHLAAVLTDAGKIHFGIEGESARPFVYCNGQGIDLAPKKAIEFLTPDAGFRARSK